MPTTRQELYLNYMLEQIGFSDESHRAYFLDKMLKIHTTYDSVSWYSNGGYNWALRENLNQLIKLLRFEISLKKKYWEIENKYSNLKVITATQLAAFTFCPASFSINESFILSDEITNLYMNIGTYLHTRKNLLLTLSSGSNYKTSSDFISEKVLENEFIKNLRTKCTLVYLSENKDQKPLTNIKLGYVGKPDYIYKFSNGEYIAIEEKYHYIRSKDSSIDNDDTEYKIGKIFDSNMVQLYSYLKYIDKIDIKWGALINWYYNKKWDTRDVFIFDVRIEIVRKSDNYTLLDQNREKIIRFRESGKLDSPINIDVNKCASCSVNIYCSHKTKNYQDLYYPYDTDQLKLHDIQFPEELRKLPEKDKNI